MRKNRKPRGFRSNVGVTEERGHNNGVASNYRRERNVLWGIINDRSFKESNPGKWKKAMVRHIKSIYGKIEEGIYIGERKDYEVLAFATQVFCPEMVEIDLWAVHNLIKIADTPGSKEFASKLHSLAEGPVYKYGTNDDRVEWQRQRSVLFIEANAGPK